MQTQTGVTVRPFNEADYHDITRIHNATFGPEFTKGADEIRLNDEREPEYCKRARWVAERDGKVVGTGAYSQHAQIYNPRRFSLEIAVDPAHYLKGIGGRLYEYVLHELEKFDPERMDEWTRADMACRVAFLEHRGFVEDMRMWASVIDLAQFEPGRFARVAAPEGIEIKSFAELGVEDLSVRERLYQLWCDTRHDVPLPRGEVRADVDYAWWWERNSRVALFPEGYFVAVEGDRFVATSQLWHSQSADTLRTGLTATRREYRRRGIAFALKVRALTFARARGYRYVQTENETNNKGMIAINDELGFVKKPAWIHYAKSFAAA